MIWLDKYDRHARVAPGLWALLPVSFTVLALGLKRYAVVSIGVSLLTAAGGPAVLAKMVREFGLAAQKNLWLEWGGPATTVALQLRAKTDNAVERDTWRQALQTVTGHRLLALRAEEKDPTKADQTIATAVGEARERTRSDQMVAAENRNYGYARNLYGFRWVGRTLATLGIIAIVILMILGDTGGKHAIPTSGAVSGIVANGLLLLYWLSAPTKTGVRTVADRYAHQLLNSIVLLSKSTAPTPPNEDQPPTSG